MSKPRVVFGYTYGVLGGVSTQLLNRFPVFSDRYDISLLYQQDHGMALGPWDVDVRVTPDRSAMAKAIADVQPDIVVCIDSPEFIHAWRDAGRPGRLIVEVHTTTTTISYLRELLDESSSDVSAILTCSEYMREMLHESGYAAIAPIHVVPNCLAVEPVIGEDHLPPGRPLLWVGKLDTHKRWRLAADVVEEALATSGGDVYPLFVGGYTAPADVMDAFLTRLYTSRMLGRAVWWPCVRYERMPRLYRAVGRAGGGLFSVTKNESFGLSIAEALAYGCPVVAPRVGALPEILPEEALFDSEDPRTAVGAVVRMLDDALFRSRLSRAGEALIPRLDPMRCLEAFEAAVAATEPLSV